MKNKYKVQKRQWGKWTVRGKATFNYIHDMLMNHYELICPPKFGQRPPTKIRKLLAWNTAWLAADAASESYE